MKLARHDHVQIGGADAEAEAAILGALTAGYHPTAGKRSSDLSAGSPMPPSSQPKAKSSPPISPGRRHGHDDCARELGLERPLSGGRIKNTRWLRSKPVPYAEDWRRPVLFRHRCLTAVFARVCVVKPDELVPLPGDLALESARHSPQR